MYVQFSAFMGLYHIKDLVLLKPRKEGQFTMIEPPHTSSVFHAPHVETYTDLHLYGNRGSIS